MGHREQLHLAGQDLLDAVQVEQADIAGNGQVNQLSPRALSQQLPGNDIAVVLHLGEHDPVTGFDVLRAPRLGDEIYALGGAARENDFVRASGVNELGGTRPRGLEGGGGAVAQFVNAAVDIGVVVLVIVAQGL